MSSTCKEGPAPWLRFPQAHTSRVRCFLGRENRLTIQKIAGPERSVLCYGSLLEDEQEGTHLSF